eukprot:Awhi_evm2s14664
MTLSGFPLFCILLLVFVNVIFVTGIPLQTREVRGEAQSFESNEFPSKLTPQELKQNFDMDSNINDKNNNENNKYDNEEQIKKIGAEKVEAMVDIINKIESLTQSVFSVFVSSGIGKAQNIEEELVHIGKTFRDLISRKTSAGVDQWRMVNSLIKYFKVSSINDEGVPARVDVVAVANELRKLLKLLKTQKSLRSPAAKMEMELLFDNYIRETTNADALEINSYKGLTYLQLGDFLNRIADILIYSHDNNKMAEIFGFLGDFLILKDALMHHTDLHLLHALSRKIESKNSDSNVVENIDLVIKNLMDHQKFENGEHWDRKDFETKRNIYLTILEEINHDPRFLKYFEDIDD